MARDDDKGYRYGAPNKPKPPKPRNPRSADQYERELDWMPLRDEAAKQGAPALDYNSWLAMLARRGQNNAATYQANKPQPGPPSPSPSPWGGGYRGGGGGGGGGSSSAINAIKTLYEQWKKPTDQTAIQNLERIAGEAQTTGGTAIGALRSLLSAQQNPYQAVDRAPLQAATNPLAAYMSAGGAPDSAVAAVGQLIDSENAAARSADERNLAMQRESWDRSQQGRMNDVGFSETAFAQALANQLAGGKFALEQQRQTRQSELMAQILQLAVQQGLDLSKLGITF